MTASAWDYFEQSIARAATRRPEPFRPSTLDFLRLVHPDADGFLELRAFGKGAPSAQAFIELPLTDARLAEARSFVLAHGLGQNIYYAIAARRTPHSGRLDNCVRLHALYVEMDLKRGRPIRELWQALHDCVLAPSAIVHSGGGLHVYWLLAEPIDLSTDRGIARLPLARRAGDPRRRRSRISRAGPRATRAGHAQPEARIRADAAGRDAAELRLAKAPSAR